MGGNPLKYVALSNKRPRDFFGPEDWTGGPVPEDEAFITMRQKEWDKMYNSLSIWQKIKYAVGGWTWL